MGRRFFTSVLRAGLCLAVLLLAVQIAPTVVWAASSAPSSEPELPEPLGPDIDAVSPEITDIQAALPADSALIQYRHVPNVSHGSSSITPPLEPHYTALLVLAGDLELIDLGSAIAIDRQVEAFRKATIPKQDTAPSARALYDAVLGPVVARVGTTRRLFIVPDANLNLVPFAALMDEGSGYAIERFSIHYLSSGRDLLRPWASDPLAFGPVVVLANPKGANLPGTELAAEALTTLFGDAQVLMGDAATEARLREHVRPRLLHVGAHGRFEHLGTHGEPMLQPGLILATPPQPRGDPRSDDGLLTAHELATMDLRGTELATLSACNSIGLRRALALAGAQTQIVSLWPIPDHATATLWNAYYPRLAAGEGRGEAMRQAQLELLRTEEHHHPSHWAALVVFGDWGPLSAERVAKVEGPEPIPDKGCGCQRASVGGNGQPSPLLLGLVGFLRRRRASHRAPRTEDEG